MLALPSPEPGHTVELSVVVMFTYDAELADRCLRAVARIADELPNTETVLVLNSASGAVRDVVAGTTGARVIESPVNTGTAVAWQLAFTLAQGAFVLLLHEDAEPLPGMVPRLIATLGDDRSIAVAGPWLDEGGERAGTNAGWLRFAERGARITPGDLPPGLAEAPYAVDEVSTAASLWRRAAWDAIGGFEERTFPAIGVEVESFAGLRARGYSVLVDPSARALHRSGTMDGAPGLLTGGHIRHFLGSRYERLMDEHWQDLMERHVSLAAHGWDGGEEIPSSAIHAELAAAQLRLSAPWRLDHPPMAGHPITNPEGRTPAPVAVENAIEERLRAAEKAVTDEYTRWLIARDAELSRLYDEVYAAYNELSERSEERQRAFDRVVSSRWWRLGARLRRLVRRS
ncbi:MAG: glycosyltransferase [Solirubrobacterales bacterium]|nr:glycosyltransferase [Solirubrobacterales bacterium]